ncbi:sensor histidine kinase [Roseateles cellulosilyticus]|uniref:histidine kinase n=1 Tax=Pelomonas cellulosilytica TaxID=2906762 RepID=A0ABS8XZA2_9BURK|nr:HAMP domain-containing sensor histidine kinase [Pelomonas sp. P8]MCE4557942.1 HAMP domain-containing histidine kinase [Pelomonas sp. P8]
MFLRTMHRSLFGQTVIIALVVAGLGIYYFGVYPFIATLQDVQSSPLATTVGGVESALAGFAINERQKPGSGQPLSANEVLKGVAAKNPQFRYFVRVRGQNYGDSRPPLFYEQAQIPKIEAFQASLSNPDYCGNLFRKVTRDDGAAGYQYGGCGGEAYYFEFSGLSTSLSNQADSLLVVLQKMTWPYSRVFLIGTAVAFLLFMLVLAANFAQIRRVTRLAESLDLERLDRKLPERGLPVEVLSLVRALNHMISRADEVQARRRFFLSAAAHEMRTPLTVLRTRLEMLDDGALKDKLVADVQRLTELVNQLLTLMSIGSRGEPTGRVDLIGCVHRVAISREPVATARGVTLEFDVQPARFDIGGDGNLVEVALANLVDNAVSVCSPGGVVTLRVGSDGTITVSDTGTGLDDETRASLFEPFVRRSSERGGYGLGLAIVKAVVDLHGGSVRGENGPTGGALFTIAWPADKRSERALSA